MDLTNEIAAAIAAEALDWAKFFNVEPTEENLEGRRMVMRANVTACNFLGPLLDYLPEPTDREIEVAMYGDGKVTTHWGQDGDPSNGERIFNTKEDDSALEAKIDLYGGEEAGRS